MSTLQELGISREDILDKVAEKFIVSLDDDGSIIDSVRRKIVSEIVEGARPKIDEILEGALIELVDTKFEPVDEWGERTSDKPTTLRQMVKDRALSFLAEKVNGDGKATTYNAVGSRGEWMAKKAASEAMTCEVKQELTKAVDAAKADLRQMVAKHIADVLLKR